ncbi:hypothetical protein [Pseudomonas syringae group sp. J309-1]|uniref:hypothetical protein n=1 Tax=Pseudomonas syringae group sp. J309-1 TaxID=3079588 RepID=UPI0029157974|nr:hypothetical protein [Pseudomonas syringae group sp. J309-1]MDU8358476.1 hypothetical protein [Pseudomonas syringae group sp. J309-1]
MSLAHVKEIVEVSDLIQANQLIESGHELLQIVPGWTGDNTPCTLFYLSKPVEPEKGQYVDGDWVPDKV